MAPEIIGGRFGIDLGALIGFVSLLVARSTARWVRLTGIVVISVGLLLPTTGALTTVVYALQLVTFGLVELTALRSDRASRWVHVGKVGAAVPVTRSTAP